MSDENYGDVAFKLTQAIISQSKSKKSPSDIVKLYADCHFISRNTGRVERFLRFEGKDKDKELEEVFARLDGRKKPSKKQVTKKKTVKKKIASTKRKSTAKRKITKRRKTTKRKATRKKR